MKITGYFKHKIGAPPAPYIRAMVRLPSGNFAAIDFLVDTGADFTVVHPADSLKLGLKAQPLNHPKNRMSSGIGGTAQYRSEDARLIFKTQGGPPVTWDTSILIGPCGDEKFQSALRAPSLLGRDFLQHCHFTADSRKNQLSLTI